MVRIMKKTVQNKAAIIIKIIRNATYPKAQHITLWQVVKLIRILYKHKETSLANVEFIKALP